MHVVTEVLPFALGAAVSPMVLMLAALALASPPRALAKGWAVVLGAGLMLTGFTLLFTLVGINLPKRHGPDLLDACTFLGFAGLLTLLAVRQLARRHQPSDGAGLTAKLGSAKPRAFFTAGLLIMASNVSSLALYLPGLRIATHSHAPSSTQAAAVFLLFLGTMAPALLPVLAASLLGRHAERPLASINRVVSTHASDITIGIEAIFIVLLTWKGIGAL